MRLDWHIGVAVFLVLLLGYLVKEAGENYQEKRWVPFWLDLAGMVAAGAGLVWMVRLTWGP